MVARRPAHRVGAAGLPRVRPAAACWSPTTRRFDIGFLKAACGRDRARPWPGFRVARHRPGWRAAWSTRDEAPQLQALLARRALRRHDDARPPGPRTTRAPPSTCCTGCSSGSGNLGVHTLEELRELHLAGHPGAAPQAAPRRAPAARARGLRVPDDAGRVLYVGTSRDLRTRVRNYFIASETAHPDGRDGRARRERSTTSSAPTPLEAAGARAAADRRAQAALQPPLPVPGEAVWLKLTDEPFPRLSIVREVRADGRRRLPRPVRLRGRPSGRGRRSTRSSRSASARAAVGLRGPARPACSPRWAAAARPATAAERRGVRRARRRGARRPDHRRRPAGRRGAERPDVARCPRRSASRTPAGAPRPARAPSSAARPGTQRLAPLAASRRAGRRAPRRPRRVGARRACATDGWPAPASSPRGADPMPYVDTLRATAETVAAGPGPTPAATAEETEHVLRWLEQPGVRLVDARRARGPAPCGGADRRRARRARRRRAVARRRWCPSTSDRRGRHRAPAVSAARARLSAVITAIVIVKCRRRPDPRGRRGHRRRSTGSARSTP